MATFDPSTLTGNTIEEVFLQAAITMQNAEQSYTVPDGQVRANRIQVAMNTDTGLATVTATVPIFMFPSPGGQLVVNAMDYIPGNA